jgi:acid phosphatase type 7
MKHSDSVATRPGWRSRAARICDSRWQRRRIAMHALICLAVLSTSMSLPDTTSRPAAAQDAACTTSGPDSGAYTVELCLVGAPDGAILTGAVTVSATVAIEGDEGPDLTHVQFYYTPLEEQRSIAVLRDYASPFTFTLPTERRADGSYRLEVEAVFTDGFVTPKVVAGVMSINGVTRRPASRGRWEPKSIGGDGPVSVAAVGNGAGGLPAADAVAALIIDWQPDLMLYLGDVYHVGSFAEFLNYYEPTLGPLKDITNPVPGEHEGGRNFQGYLDYWDSKDQFYTATAGSWRLIGLNSTERFGQTAPGTPQFEWLRTQLADDDDAGCTLVYLHNARWGVSDSAAGERLDALWRLLVDEGVDIVLTAEEHYYQRWKPLDGEGVPNEQGTTQFAVGTGGHTLAPLPSADDRVVAVHATDGALRLQLDAGTAGVAFVDTTGTVLDTETVTCSGAPTARAVTAPTRSAAGRDPLVLETRRHRTAYMHRYTSVPSW